MLVSQRHPHNRAASEDATPDDTEATSIELQEQVKDADNMEQVHLHDQVGLISSGGECASGDNLTLIIAYGKPSSKPRIDIPYLLIVFVSIAALILSVVIVAHDRYAWSLGYNNQLILAGISVAAMNLCLNHLAPDLFLMLEVRFGRSSLQNVEGLMRKSLTRNRVDLSWRIVLLICFFLHLGWTRRTRRATSGRASVPFSSTSPQCEIC